MKVIVNSGSFTPLGSSQTKAGINFSVLSHHATAMEIRFFKRGEKAPFASFPMNRTGDSWHLEVENLPESFEYTYRADGPYSPEKGHLFNPKKDLIDPYGRVLNSSAKWGSSKYANRTCYESPKSFDWECTSRPLIPLEDLIIYEMHVRSFTQHPSSKVSEPGTFRGMIEKIPYLKDLGVNAIELMPIHEFNEVENQKSDKPLYNYWGYSTANFFSPMRRYGTTEDLKNLVKELHRENIEVILDVVYNHTSEGSDMNHYFSFRGLDNETYYIVNGKDYYNYSGCGNTVRCQHPIVQDLILDSLRYFVTEFHIDGFRFDLASVFTRDIDGEPMEDPPLVKRITKDPILSQTKFIAEPWDAAGLVQVGSFPSWKFSEWNGKYRDDVRSFMKGDGSHHEMKQRLLGSPDLYQKTKSPLKSINFITAHDGFTLRDLVSYNEKHNEENGEDNKDGNSDTRSWNCGVEGETDDPEILNLRMRQMRNFLLALFVSRGIPMLLMGDEYGHTRQGNNNAWCQDNEKNYFLWDRDSPLFEFVKKLIAFRKHYDTLKQKDFNCEAQWEEEGYLGLTLQEDLFIAFNPSNSPCRLQKKGWYLLIDTSKDVFDESILCQDSLELQPFSSVLLCKKK